MELVRDILAGVGLAVVLGVVVVWGFGLVVVFSPSAILGRWRRVGRRHV